MELFKNIIGYEGEKKILARVCDSICNRELYAKAGARLPKGVLLQGKPGVGKTVMANDLLAACALPVYRAKKQHSDKATIESLFKAYRKAAENAPALVFLDDMDKLAESEDDYYNQDAFTAIQSCMEDTKHCNVVTIATVNDTDCLPSSLLRKGRFDVVLTIGLPSRKEAEQIIAHYLQNKPINKRSVRASDLAALLTGYSCADLETVLNEAMSLAVYERKAVLDNRHIVETIMTSLYEILPYDYPANAKELTETAVSIAGKLTAAVTAKHISPYFATVCGGGALYYNTSPEYGDSVESLREEMCMRLAGSAAVGLHSGVQDANCEGDIKQAYRIAYQLVAELCCCGFDCTDRFGQLYDYMPDAMLEHVAEKIAEELERAKQHAKEILQANEALFQNFKKQLLAHKYLTIRELRKAEKR